jgi:hypothetical protein
LDNEGALREAFDEDVLNSNGARIIYQDDLAEVTWMTRSSFKRLSDNHPSALAKAVLSRPNQPKLAVHPQRQAGTAGWRMSPTADTTAVSG